MTYNGTEKELVKVILSPVVDTTSEVHLVSSLVATGAGLPPLIVSYEPLLCEFWQ